MMEAYLKYVPVLRAKKGEWEALRHLSDVVRQRTTPLIEFVPDSWKIDSGWMLDVAQKELRSLASNIRTDWHFAPFFIDMTFVSNNGQYPCGIQPISDLGRELNKLGIKFVPVFRLTSTEDYLGGVREAGLLSDNGYCLRISLADMVAKDFPDNLKRAESTIYSKRSDLDLIVDFEIADEMLADWMAKVWQCIRNKTEWRSITFIAGSFPKDLSQFTANDQHLHPRLEWRAWRKLIAEIKTNCVPGFGDYTIQYAGQRKPIRRGDRSASIRYTSTNDWIIMRGASIKTYGPEQYYANALLLTERPEYGPQKFCEGDRFISSKARNEAGPGNATNWVRTGINRHISFTVHQIADVFGVAIDTEPGPVLSVN